MSDVVRIEIGSSILESEMIVQEAQAAGIRVEPFGTNILRLAVSSLSGVAPFWSLLSTSPNCEIFSPHPGSDTEHCSAVTRAAIARE